MDSFKDKVADANDDGEISAADLVAIVNIIAISGIDPPS